MVIFSEEATAIRRASPDNSPSAQSPASPGIPPYLTPKVDERLADAGQAADEDFAAAVLSVRSQASHLSQ